MRKLPVLAAALWAALTLSGQTAQDPSAIHQLYEKGPMTTVVPYQVQQGYGQSRVLQVGSKVRMYTTGVEHFGTSRRDKVWLWEAPNTVAGWTSQYTKRVAPLLPATNCSTGGSTPYACRTDYNYTMHWAWQNPPTVNPNVYLLAGTGTIQHDWEEVLLGESLDGGQSFRWKPLLKTTNGVHFVKISWQPFLVNGIWQFFGYVDFKYHPEDRAWDGRADQGVGAIRFTPAFANPFMIGAGAKMEVWAEGGTNGQGAWQTLPRCNDGTGYVFCLNVNPKLTLPNHRFGDLYRMSALNDTLELWTSTDDKDFSCLCDVREDRAAVRQNAFAYFPVATPTFAAGENPLALIGPRRILRQKATRLRCMPGAYSHSRKHPVRLEWTRDVLLSRVWETPEHTTTECPPPMAGPYGWIVATRLTADVLSP